MYSSMGGKAIMIPDSLGPEQRLAMGMGPSPTPPTIGLGTAEIEVDDEEETGSDVEIDIRQFRVARFGAVRA
jgi:hypothetical protein